MRVRARQVDDRYVGVDGRAVILVGQLALVVSPAAVVILDALQMKTEQTVDELTQALVVSLGTPPAGVEASQVVQTTCEHLHAAGAVEIVSA